MRKKIESIEGIRRRFKRRPEWLLIRVKRIDEARTIPLTGRLLAHSPDRDEIYRLSLKYRGPLLIDNSQERLPKGYAVAF